MVSSPPVHIFLDLADLKLELDERPEDLFQRLTAFFEDSLLSTTCGLSHHGEVPTDDEDISPSLENINVLLWLKLIHKHLPRLVKQRYGTELRSRILASIKPEISQTLESLLNELHTSKEAKIMRSASFHSSGENLKVFLRLCPDLVCLVLHHLAHYASKPVAINVVII